MPSKGKGKGKSKGKGHARRPSGEDSYGLQAIILADSYIHKRFRPISHLMPKMLIPLAGGPMINYSIDLLINSNVNEIFIICSSHAQQLEDCINSSQWKNAKLFPKLQIHIIRIDNCSSVGAALRHMHTLDYIQSKTFILCRGDCIANVSLKHMINKHQQRYKEDSNTLMTCLFKQAHYKQRSASLEDDLFIVTNDNDELLQYENDSSKLDFSFDLAVFDDHEDVEIHHNVVDCGIDICSKTVLSLFEDNFDYESIRKELFEGVIRSEIYNYKVYAWMLNNENEYASRVLDWRTYAGVTFDIIERWTHPLVLDSNTISHNYAFERNNVYKEDGVKIGLQTKIRKNAILGFNTCIGDQCHITKCVIGPNCKIGNQCRIENSFIFGDCTIGNGTTLNGVVLANNVCIGNHCVLPKGCILSFGVMLDHNIQLKPYSKIIANKAEQDDLDNDDDFGFDSDDDDENDNGDGSDKDEEEVELPKQRRYKQSPKGRVRSLSATQPVEANSGSPSTEQSSAVQSKSIMDIMNDSNETNESTQQQSEEDDVKYDTHIVGNNGKGFLYEISRYDESYVMDSVNNVLATYADRPIRGASKGMHDDYAIGDEFGALPKMTDINVVDAPIGNGNGNELKAITPRNVENTDNLNDIEDAMGSSTSLNVNKLVSEIAACIDNAESNKSINMDNVVIEITTSVRLSNNAPLEEFSCAVFLVLLNRIAEDAPFQSKKDEIERYVEKYCCLFEKLSKKEEDQMKVIIGLFNACNTRQRGLIYFFLQGLDKLFFEDTVSLTAIQKWNEQRSKSDDEQFEKYLLQYLQTWQEALEEDDDDDDDDDDEEEESED